MLEHRRQPIWYALAALPTLLTAQWQALVEDVVRGEGDRVFLRMLFERPDRSDADRQWLLDRVGLEVYLDEVLASPVATAKYDVRLPTAVGVGTLLRKSIGGRDC